jgi:LysR family hydrogen peroxide-inducible transcriptional activator
LHLHIEEMPTAEIIRALNEDRIDTGVLVTPLHQSSIEEIPLFYEPFFVYASPGHALLKQKHVQEKELSLNDVFLLSEGHCFRDQVLNLCRTRTRGKSIRGVEFESGSLQTLKRMVDEIPGYTFLPELAAEDLLSSRHRDQLREFAAPAPVREVSLVVHKSFIKRKMVEALRGTIQKTVPKEMLGKPLAKQVIEIG